MSLDGPPTGWPLQLAGIYRATLPGDGVALDTPARAVPAHAEPEPEDTPSLTDLVVGAGFQACRGKGHEITRSRSLPDTVGPDMRLLVCGLNPSIYAADAGVGFARPGNRFWPAAIAAGLVVDDRDPLAALERGVGMTDLVKRATPRAAELEAQEYREGLERVSCLVSWLAPEVVCFVGLAGWRAAMDRSATAGIQQERLGGRPVYVMPSTSGLNTHTSLDDCVTHLNAAARLGNATYRC